MLYGLETKLYEDVAVEQLLCLDFVQSLLSLTCIFLENFVYEEIHSVLVDTKIGGEFKLRHFFDL